MSHSPARPRAYGSLLVGTSAPDRQGLYDPAYEHDSCGVAFVVDVRGRRSHDMVQKGLTALRNLDHRGAQGSDPDTGDGAGILMQMPDGSSARSSTSRCRRPAGTPPGSSSCRASPGPVTRCCAASPGSSARRS